MDNKTADTTEQIKTMVAIPLLIDEISDKYKDLKAKYPSTKDLQYRTLSSTWREQVSAKAIGLLGLLAYWSSNNMDYDNYAVARINPIWIARKLGYAEKQASRHTKQIQQLLLELHHAELIKIRPDHATKTQTIEIINEKDQANGYCKLYSPAVQVIIEQSKGMAMLYNMAIYVAIRSITFESTNATMTRTPTNLGSMLDLSVTTVQKHLAWLRDHGALCWYKLVLANEYHTVKYVYADPVNVKDLTAWTIDHLIAKDPRLKHYIAKVVA